MNGWLTTLLNRQSVDWWDLLDILIVSVLIYEVLKLIRGTRAVQMAVGTALVAGLFYASQWSRLETRQLAHSERGRLPGLWLHRPLPVRPSPRPGASGSRAVLSLSRAAGRRRRDD